MRNVAAIASCLQEYRTLSPNMCRNLKTSSAGLVNANVLKDDGLLSKHLLGGAAQRGGLSLQQGAPAFAPRLRLRTEAVLCGLWQPQAVGLLPAARCCVGAAA